MTKKPNLDPRFLDKKETYALMLSAIYASEADPNYRLLSDLMYLLDDKAFKEFLTLFEGQTIRIPTIAELTEMLKALTIYTYKDIHQLSWKEVAKLGGAQDSPSNPYKGSIAYQKLKAAMRENKVSTGGIFDEFPSKVLDLN